MKNKKSLEEQLEAIQDNQESELEYNEKSPLLKTIRNKLAFYTSALGGIGAVAAEFYYLNDYDELGVGAVAATAGYIAYNAMNKRKIKPLEFIRDISIAVAAGGIVSYGVGEGFSKYMEITARSLSDMNKIMFNLIKYAVEGVFTFHIGMGSKPVSSAIEGMFE